MSILDKVVLVKLTARAWSASKKVAAEDVVDASLANPKHLGVTKHLVDKVELKAMQSTAGTARASLAAMSLPFPIAGVFAVPKTMIEEAVAKLTSHDLIFQEQANAFAYKYPSLRAARRLELGALFNPTDWPSDGKIRSLFGLEWALVTVGPADDLPDSIRAQEITKFHDMIMEFGREATTALRVRFAELIDHAVDRLQGSRQTKDGQGPQIFRDSLVENLQDFVSVFNGLNVVNDQELAALVTRAKGMITNVDAATLRDNNALRERVAKVFAEVQGNLDKMMVDRPTRKIRLPSEEAGRQAK